MAYQGISTGTTPNDNSGDSLLVGAVKINSNFKEIYNALGNGNSIGQFTSSAFVAQTPESATLDGVLTYKMFRSNGTQSFITSREVTNALGYVPANVASSGSGTFPLGNSVICDDISSFFNGSTTNFTLRISGNTFTPAGSAANLLVSLGGVIQKPGSDFLIVQSGGSNTSTIQFTTAPASGTSCFIVALGGQGSLVSNVDWDTKGQILVATADNSAIKLSVGTNGQVLTADSAETSGVKWAAIPSGIPVGGIIMWSGTIASIAGLSGWALCDGTNGTPDLRNRFVVGAGSGAGIGTSPTTGPGFDATTGALSVNYTPGNTGGETAHKLTTSELASHTHNYYNIDSSAAAGNSGVRTNAGSGPFTPTSSTGEDKYHENRPPYYALAYIMRIS